MSRPRFVAVALGVKVERRLYAAVAKQALNGLRVGLALVHQPVGRLKVVWPRFSIGEMTVLLSRPW